MPIKTVCPECQAAYQLADHQLGKKVRCKSCDTVFEVAQQPSRPSAIRGENGPSSQARPKPATVTTRRDGLNRGVRDEEDEQEQQSRDLTRSVEKKNHTLLWVLGGAAVGFGLLLLVSGAIIGALLVRDKPPEMANRNPSLPPMMAPVPPVQPVQAPPVIPAPPQDKPVQGQPVEQPSKPKDTAKAVNPPTTAIADASRDSSPVQNGRLSEEGRDRVKRSTVYLRVKMPDGTQATGSGFFGCKEAQNIILTNAHVVGMLAPDSARPVSVEVIVNSGEANEWKTNARVLGVDRASDLAVLDIGKATQPLPEPLTVRTAGGLHQLDDVYVFGFPFGEQLGKEITIRPASVSALRKNQKSGTLERLQVNGGMDPGNSGGPVVDTRGAVVGVAVSVIPGRQINFAIPGERVQAILEGRVSDVSVQQPFFTGGNKVALPLVMDMIDPRNLIKEVGVEVWTGDNPSNPKSGSRPPSTTQPAAQTGDSPHVYYPLKYMPPEGKAEIVLPDLPPGKVYWKQPKWINAKGEAHWASANPMSLPAQPVHRKSVNLALHYSPGAKRSLDLTIDNVLKLGNDDDADAFRIRTTAQFTETVASSGANGTQLNLRYKYAPSRELILPDGQSIANPTLEKIKDNLPRTITSMLQLDRLGNIIRQDVDPRPLLQLGQTNPEQVKLMKEFHEMIQQGLASLSVSLPGSGTANPLDSWRAERPLPIDTPGKSETGKLEVTFTYQGVRKRDGREEAVISMDGFVRGKDEAVGGKAEGKILVDVANGQTILAETTVKLQLKAMLGKPGETPRELRVLDIMNFRMQRKS